MSQSSIEHRIFTRDDWHARRPSKAMTSQGAPTEAFLHHSDDQHGNTWHTLVAQCEKMQQIQDFHIDGRGWSDIAYHYVVFQYVGAKQIARAFEARPVRYVPAAQERHNTGTLAICVVGNGEAETIARNTRYMIERLLKKYPSVKTLGGHRDVTATACPGDEFYKAIPRIARAAGLRVYKHR